MSCGFSHTHAGGSITCSAASAWAFVECRVGIAHETRQPPPPQPPPTSALAATRETASVNRVAVLAPPHVHGGHRTTPKTANIACVDGI